nr:hypothetical protein [Tanacetum cinerariifolium]
MTKKSFPHRPERATDLLGIIHTDVCGPLIHVSRQGASYFITFTDDYSRYGYVYLLKHKHEGREALVKWDTPDKLQQRSVMCIFIGYPKDTMGYYFYFPPENKIVVTRYAEFFEKNLITQKVSGRAIDLEEIQDEDTLPSEITSDIPMEVKGFEPPQKKVISIHRSKRIHRAPNRLCLNVEMEEHSLGDLNEPASYKAANEAAFILGIKIYRYRSKRLIRLGQNTYMDKILKRYKMDNSKRGHIPMQERLDLNKTQGTSTPKEVKRMQNVHYASAVGSIMYALRCTRPDVVFTQNITSRFQQNFDECHWTAMKNILKYLRNTKDMFLVYGGNPEAELRVDFYCNAGFETDIDDIKSLTGKFISRLDIVSTINEPIKMFCDNSAALFIASKPGVQMGTKHYHRSNFLKVYTDDNPAYPLMMALLKESLLNMLGA